MRQPPFGIDSCVVRLPKQDLHRVTILGPLSAIIVVPYVVLLDLLSCMPVADRNMMLRRLLVRDTAMNPPRPTSPLVPETYVSLYRTVNDGVVGLPLSVVVRWVHDVLMVLPAEGDRLLLSLSIICILVLCLRVPTSVLIIGQPGRTMKKEVATAVLVGARLSSCISLSPSEGLGRFGFGQPKMGQIRGPGAVEGAGSGSVSGSMSGSLSIAGSGSLSGLGDALDLVMVGSILVFRTSVTSVIARECTYLTAIRLRCWMKGFGRW